MLLQKAASTKPTKIRIDTMRTGLEIFFVKVGKKWAQAIPINRGSNKIPDMFRNRSRKLTSMFLMLSRSPGIVDDQNKKLRGVTRNAMTEVMAVSVTDKATLPFASSEKKLDAFPPGQAATRIIPNAIPVGGDHIKISAIVKAGNKIYCENTPVANAFFWCLS